MRIARADGRLSAPAGALRRGAVPGLGVNLAGTGRGHRAIEAPRLMIRAAPPLAPATRRRSQRTKVRAAFQPLGVSSATRLDGCVLTRVSTSRKYSSGLMSSSLQLPTRV